MNTEQSDHTQSLCEHTDTPLAGKNQEAQLNTELSCGLDHFVIVSPSLENTDPYLDLR